MSSTVLSWMSAVMVRGVKWDDVGGAGVCLEDKKEGKG